jgi:hypothetical protein
LPPALLTLRVSELRPQKRRASSKKWRFIVATAACRIERQAAVTGMAETLKRFSELAALPLGSNPKAGNCEDYGFEWVEVLLEGFRLWLAGFDPIVGMSK